MYLIRAKTAVSGGQCPPYVYYGYATQTIKNQILVLYKGGKATFILGGKQKLIGVNLYL